MSKRFKKKDKLYTNFDNNEILREEDNLIRCYGKDDGHPIRILFGLYGRHKLGMSLSSLFSFGSHSI